VRVQHHIILIRCIAVHVSTSGGDGAQLDHQGILAAGRLIVAQCGAVASTAVSILQYSKRQYKAGSNIVGIRADRGTECQKGDSVLVNGGACWLCYKKTSTYA
jgi:hypothetical protein